MGVGVGAAVGAAVGPALGRDAAATAGSRVSGTSLRAGGGAGGTRRRLRHGRRQGIVGANVVVGIGHRLDDGPRARDRCRLRRVRPGPCGVSAGDAEAIAFGIVPFTSTTSRSGFSR